MHLDIAAVEILSLKTEDYFRTQQSWKAEVWEHNERMKGEGTCSLPMADDDGLVKKRQEELKHAQNVRELYERKLERAITLFLDLNAKKLRIEQWETELQRREQILIYNEKSSSKKKFRPTVSIQNKPEISFIRTSSPLRSTSPDSPTHLGAAASKPSISPRQFSFSSEEPKRGETRAEPQYVEKLQQKKTRHRRCGSHCPADTQGESEDQSLLGGHHGGRDPDRGHRDAGLGQGQPHWHFRLLLHV